MHCAGRSPLLLRTIPQCRPKAAPRKVVVNYAYSWSAENLKVKKGLGEGSYG
jgi:hypothetical protein